VLARLTPVRPVRCGGSPLQHDISNSLEVEAISKFRDALASGGLG
jgi:hypothetical protein